MKKQSKFLALSLATVAMFMVTSCSQDDLFQNPQNEPKSKTRANENPDGSFTITFEDFDNFQMASSPYGENYYRAGGKGNQVKNITDPDWIFVSEVNTIKGAQDFHNGGIALSKYNYRSDRAGDPAHWWQSFNNQFSVYNVASRSGANAGAGHNGSNNFAVAFGHSDYGNQEYVEKPYFFFDSAYTLESLWICNSSCTYGVIQNGNRYGNIGVATPLSSINGYFAVELECYDWDENLLATKTFMLADYRNPNNPVHPISEWTKWDINVDNVGIVRLNFKGSDMDPVWGLNTPAYICIDDITIR